MRSWAYAIVRVTLFREGNSNAPARELYSVSFPNQVPTAVDDAFGLPGVLNQLGSEGWELVDVESGAYYFKRPVE